MVFKKINRGVLGVNYKVLGAKTGCHTKKLGVKQGYLPFLKKFTGKKTSLFQ